MSNPTAVILVVGLNESLIGEWSPNLRRFCAEGATRKLEPVLPAVTCSVQSSMLTGSSVSEHGIVANGWFDRQSNEVRFWKQSNRLVGGEKVWETARKREPQLTCLNMFWWYNMYSSADYSVTPRPVYKADGRKIPDCYSHPFELRDQLQSELGQFPLFRFWGPASSIESSRWIADATVIAHRKLDPTLTLVYLPHLDYALQKLGSGHQDIKKHVSQIDEVVGDLLSYFDSRSIEPMIVSEYGIEPVSRVIPINKMLREENCIAIREEMGLELLDAGASAAFAVADHQVAHVYVKHRQNTNRVLDICRKIPGVEQALDKNAQSKLHINHERSGDIVLVAAKGHWFSYHYWLDDAKAPDFARTVDIHRKPGYDPCELFIDPAIISPKVKIALKLLKKKLGFRTLMDVIPLDNSLVKGSHGRVEIPEDIQPILVTRKNLGDIPEKVHCEKVRDIILQLLFA
ncbi:MAG: alkaline phosphatase family protein [Planctomycetota bacterium]|jgi:predicted AlkP superfamily pyrophosphatase or phosphodiesterase